MQRHDLRAQIEREMGYALERSLDTALPQRVRPRLGGEAPLPNDGQTSDLFLVTTEDLTKEEQGASGWCVRLGVPEAIPALGGSGYDLHELIVELSITMGGASYTQEVNAFPGCQIHMVGEQIGAKVRWGTTPIVAPADTHVRWQLSRGLCSTTAKRGFTVQAATTGNVPAFATGFALFSGATSISEDIQLDFAPHATTTHVLQHYTRDDLLQAVSAFTPLPPTAGQWRWLTATASPVRLVFCYGDL